MVDIEQIYRIGYVTRQKEKDYDPLASDAVCSAIEKVRSLQQEVERLKAELARVKALYEEWGFKDAPCPRHSKDPLLLENNCASCRSEELEGAIGVWANVIVHGQGIAGITEMDAEKALLKCIEL